MEGETGSDETEWRAKPQGGCASAQQHGVKDEMSAGMEGRKPAVRGRGG